MVRLIDDAPVQIYINPNAGDGGQWFLQRHGVKYIKASPVALADELRSQGYDVTLARRDD